MKKSRHFFKFCKKFFADVNAAITAKGQETIASIPSDYTTLSNTVNRLVEEMPVVDTSLTIPGAAADSYVTGLNFTRTDDEIDTLFSLINNDDPVFTYVQGYYDGSMTFYPGITTQITTDLMKLPAGLVVNMHHAGCYVVMREYQYIGGTWVRTVDKSGSNTDSITIGSSDYLYCFGLYNAVSVTPADAANLTMTFDYDLHQLYTAPYVKSVAVTDCDQIRSNGIYNVNAGTANLPAGVTLNGMMMVYGSSIYRMIQIFSETNTNYLWCRVSVNDTVWGTWFKLLGETSINEILTKYTRILFISKDITLNGDHVFNDALQIGAYNANMIWDASQNHQVSIPYLISGCEGMMIRAITFNTSVQVYIKEYEYQGGTYVRTRAYNGINVTMDCLKDHYYNIALYDPNNIYVTPPTTGFIFYAFSNKIENCRFWYDTATKSLTLMSNKYRYIIRRQVDNSINLDSWRLYQGDVLINGYWTNMWQNSDAEGPVQIDNEADFISGFHGDEEFTNAAIVIDNDALDLSQDASGKFNSVMLYQESTVYHANTTNPAFTRYKRVRIKGADFDVQQRWIALGNCTVTRGALCLMQCYWAAMNGWDTDLLLPTQTNNDTLALNNNTRQGSYYLLNGDKMTLTAEYGADAPGYAASGNSYSGQQRCKFYFDMYNGQSLTTGDELLSKFSVTYNTVQ